MPRHLIEIDGATLEIFQAGALSSGLAVAAAHPATTYTADTARLLGDIAQKGILCVNPRGLGASTAAEGISLEEMVDDIESIRRHFALSPWVFWGMSGGGWLAQVYAHRHPEGLAGIIVESACTCFRARLADPSCGLSPFFPAWRAALQSQALLSEGAHFGPLLAAQTEWIFVEGAGAVLRRRGGPALLVSPVAVAPELKAALPRLLSFDSREWIGTIRTPTLVIAGEIDPVVPVQRVREVHQAIAASTFIVVAGGGHVPSAERRPEAVTAVRAFLAKLA
jgi:pimeloyl-ACP methyl ester carboxylesterase